MREKPKPVSIFFHPGSAVDKTCWRPPVDIYRTGDGWLLKFDLAGVRPEDVSVRVQGCRITVEGTRLDRVVEGTMGQYLMEISYNRFERTVDLPCDLRNPRVEIEGRDGILIVRLKQEERER